MKILKGGPGYLSSPVMLVVSHLGVHIKLGAGDSLKTGVDLMLAQDQDGLSVADALGNWKMNFCSVDVLHHV